MKTNFNRDIIIIFLLFVVGDIFTTWLFISTGSGVEGNPLMVKFVNNGVQGYFSIFIIKIIVLCYISILMAFLIKFDVPKMYLFFKSIIITQSSVVIISNFLVYFLGKNIFELIGIW